MKKIILSFFVVISIFCLSSNVVKATPELNRDIEGGVSLNDEIPVDLYVFTDSKATPIYFPLTKNYGSKVQLSTSIGESPSGYEFVYWNVNGFIRQDLPYDHQFVIYENMSIAAVFKPVDAHVICFMDANKQLIDWQYITTADPFTSADVPSLSSIDKPGYEIASNPWGVTVDFDNITDDTYLTLQYVPIETPSTYEISVTNGTGSGTYDFDSVVTVVANTAPEGQYFSYWGDENDNFVSILPTYTFSAYEDKTLIAYYDTYPTEDFAYATLSNPLYLREDKVTFVGQFYLPEGCELIEYGIEITDFIDVNEKYKVSNLNPETGEFVATFDAEWGLFANIYVTYINPLDPETLSYLREDTPTSLVKVHPIISEYGEGSSFNKWIEIYNPSNSETINLDNYQIHLYSGGSTTPAILYLEGSLLPGDVFVASHASANADILALADATSSTVINFNGDDAIGIYYEGSSEIIDVIGVIGTDPGTKWDIIDGSTLDNTIYRNFGINQPQSSWIIEEWTGLPQDTISKLGYHENDMPSSITYNGSLTLMEGQTEQLTAIYNPLDSIRDGVWDSSNDAIATVSETGLVTAISEGTVHISITSSYGPFSSVLWTITAPVMYDVTATSSNDAHGTVSASPTSVLEGNNSSITITPASGYLADTITINGGTPIDLEGETSYVISNITSDTSVLVTFVLGDTLEKTYEFNFTTTSLTTSYNTGTYTVQNIITSSNFSVLVARVAANTTTSVTGATKAAILSPRLGDSTGISYFEMDFGSSILNKIEFDLYYWNSTAISYFTKIELQVYNSNTSSWDVVEDLKTYLNGSLTINTYSLTSITGTKYRIYAEGGKTSANDARLCIDNIKIYS